MSIPRYERYKQSGVKWLGEVPEHWVIRRYKQVFRERDERSTDGSQTLLSVSAYTGVTPRRELIDNDDVLVRAESLEGYKVCYPDDLVMNIMLAWNRGLAFTKYYGVVSPAYSVFDVISSDHPAFLNYLLRADETIHYFKAFSSGVIDSRLRLYPDVFAGLFCALPDATEQERIVAFLDREMAKIDALVEEQRRLIALLKEKRQAVISHAVAGHSSATLAARKESQIAWFGTIPSHWQTKALKWLTQPGRSIMYGIVLPGPDVEDGVPILKGGNVKPSRMRLSEMARTTSEIEAPYARARLKVGDLAYSIRGTIGDCEIVPDELEGANITQDVARIAPSDEVDGRWVRWSLLSDAVRESLACGSLGAAVRGINIFDLKRAKIPVPPLPEQATIASSIDSRVSRLECLQAEVERSVLLLQEHRSTLISAVVTGKIDVRGLAANTAEVPEAACELA